MNKQPNIDDLRKRMEQSRLSKLRGDLDQLIESDPKLRALRPHLKIDLVQEGLRIQIIDSQNRPMFKTGSAEVEPYMRDILRAIAPVLNGSLTGSAFPVTRMITLTRMVRKGTATGNCLLIAQMHRVASWLAAVWMMEKYYVW